MTATPELVQSMPQQGEIVWINPITVWRSAIQAHNQRVWLFRAPHLLPTKQSIEQRSPYQLMVDTRTDIQEQWLIKLTASDEDIVCTRAVVHVSYIEHKDGCHPRRIVVIVMDSVCVPSIAGAILFSTLGANSSPTLPCNDYSYNNSKIVSLLV